MSVFSFTFPPVHTKPLKTHSGTLVIFLILMLTIPKCLHTDTIYTVSVKHNNLYYYVTVLGQHVSTPIE